MSGPKHYDTWDQIELGSLSPEAQVELLPIMDLVSRTQHVLDDEISQYKELSEQFTTLISKIDEAKQGDIKPLVAEYEDLNQSFNIMSTENVELCQRMFKLQFPEYDNQSNAVKTAFVTAMRHDSFHSRHIGDSLYDKMVDAYKLVLYRNGGQSSPSIATGTSSSAPAKSQRTINPNAAKQALVSGGEMASALPSPNLKEMSYDDILSRGEHLLDI